MRNAPQGRLATVDYSPPRHPGEVQLDIVTPTCNRPDQLVEQAKRIGTQMGHRDRWIIVDDASARIPDWRNDIVPTVPSVDQLFIIALTYAKGDTIGTVNRSRHLGISVTRPDSWVIEIDDHDFIEPDCLQLIRDAICRGAIFIYGDLRWFTKAQGQDVPGLVFDKPDYQPYLLRDRMSPCEGVRAFPRWLYDAVGGYRYQGVRGKVGGNEFPGGDYGLFMRMELFAEGQGFHRIPAILCRTYKVPGSITARHGGQQFQMAQQLRAAAKHGTLINGPDTA